MSKVTIPVAMFIFQSQNRSHQMNAIAIVVADLHEEIVFLLTVVLSRYNVAEETCLFCGRHTRRRQ